MEGDDTLQKVYRGRACRQGPGHCLIEAPYKPIYNLGHWGQVRGEWVWLLHNMTLRTSPSSYFFHHHWYTRVLRTRDLAGGLNHCQIYQWSARKAMRCGAWQIFQSLNRLIPIENWQLAYVGTCCAAIALDPWARYTPGCDMNFPITSFGPSRSDLKVCFPTE